MSLNLIDPEPLAEHDDSTVYTGFTPPETVLEDDPLPPDSAKVISLPVPYPGSTFIIRSVSCGRVLTLLNGQVLLTSPGTRDGHIHWKCTENKGWLSFQNSASGRYLGHDKGGGLCCSAERHQGWENFCSKVRPDGTCFLVMTHWERLYYVGMKPEWGEGRMAKIGEAESDATAWEFIKV